MGVLPNIFKKPSIGKIASTVLTGGVSLAVPKLQKVIAPIAEKVFNPPLSTVVGIATRNPSLAVSGFLPVAAPVRAPVQGGQPMALNIGGILGQVGTIFGGGQNPYFQGVSNVANLASQFFPSPTMRGIGSPGGVATPVMAAAPAIRAVGSMVGRGFFNRFPNLATGIQQLRARGMNISRSRLWSTLKRFGPEVLVTGGLLTAAAVSELMIAGPGHRRMNPANSKALRRSVRRIQSFHRLCKATDVIGRKRTRVVGRRCGTCRSAPCRC